MATSSIDYLTGTRISPSPSPTAASASPAVSPSPAASAPAPSAGGLWNGHLKPAEIQIIIIGISLHQLHRHLTLHKCPQKLTSDIVAQLVYGLKQVLAHEEAPKPL
ncbi:TPA: hypothetical protein ACH3X1_001863 [Trebouxia sp. C0004]